MLKKIAKKLTELSIKLTVYLVRIIKNGWFLRPLIIKCWKTHGLNLGDTNINFGCWGWETVDINNADHKVNFRNGNLPFQDNSIKVIYSSHMIEHIFDESAQVLFNEIYRILEKGSRFRFVCPDLDKAIDAYQKEDLFFFLRSEFLLKGIRKGDIHKDSLLLHNNLIRVCASYVDTGAGPIVNKNTF